jgi:ligand-binding SRPBCC domain-containing protein
MNQKCAISQNHRVFEKSSIIKTDLETLVAFHENPKAIRLLTPPPIFVQVREDKRLSLTEGDLLFTLWFAFIPVKWHARHEAGSIPSSFADLMIEGPMAYWRHEHIFEPMESGVKLTDRITLAHKTGWRGLLSRLFFDGLPLQFLFFYRHLRTKWKTEKK